MKIKHLLAKLERIHMSVLLVMLVFIFSSYFVAPASALDPELRKLFNNGVYDYDPNPYALCTTGPGSGGGSGVDVTQLTGDDVQGKIFNYLVQKGLTKDQAAGVMGNIQEESGFQIDNQQNGYAWPAAGWGLVQWSFDRRTAIATAMQEAGIGDLYSAAYADGKTPPDRQDELLLFQLNYLWKEFQTSHKSSYDELVASQNYTDATDAILVKFEHPFSPMLKWENRKSDSRWQAQMAKRVPHSQAILEKYGGGTSSTPTSGSAGASNTPVGTKTVIALDPGHGGKVDEYTHIEKDIPLRDRETTNSPEREDVLEVAQRVKAELEQSGYQVVLLRSTADEAINKADRVKKAKEAEANLVVSIHTGPGTIDEVWPQRVGTYREYEGRRLEITNEETAKKSQQYADAIAKAREAAEGHAISLDPNNEAQAGSFNRDDVPSKGNVSLVQLWGQDLPWVYNEIGQDDGTALSPALKNKYAKGLVDGIKAALPSANTGASANGTCAPGSIAPSGNAAALQLKTLEYAWPVFKGNGYKTMKPEYEAAVKKAQSEGLYVGGIDYPGVDCGGFVTRLVINSGWDPAYNNSGRGGNTTAQFDWAETNWQRVPLNGGKLDTATLQPGDVAIKKGFGEPGHTFIYVGTIDGFGSNIASASLDNRAPMAGTEELADPAMTWFRKK